MTRIIGGVRRRPPDRRRRGAATPGRPATGCARRCSPRRVVVRVAARAAVPRPVRRLRRGRARGVVARAPASSRSSSRTGAPRALIRDNARDLGLRPGRRRARPSVPATLAAARRAVRRGVPRPAVPAVDDEAVGADLGLLQTTAGSCRARWSWSSARSRSPEPAWPAGFTDVAASALRRDRRFGTVTPRLDRPGGTATTCPCAEPSAPGRSTRSPTVTSTSSARAAALFDEVVVAVGVNKSKKPAVHPRRADRDARAGVSSRRQRAGRRASPACSPTSAGEQDVQADRQGPARGQRLRLRAADGPDERLA